MYRVMIVDDEPLILAGIASMLNWEEYDCAITGKAANGLQALKQMEDQKPDIVITDIKMPAMDGIGLMKGVKERGWDDLSFIILTNLEEFSLARQALSLGAVEYLVKMELTEEKLAGSLKLAMERCDMKRRAGQAGTGAAMSREDMMRQRLEQLLSGEEDGPPAPAEADDYLREPVFGLRTATPTVGPALGLRTALPAAGRTSGPRTAQPAAGRTSGLRTATPAAGRTSCLRTAQPAAGRASGLRTVTSAAGREVAYSFGLPASAPRFCGRTTLPGRDSPLSDSGCPAAALRVLPLRIGRDEPGGRLSGPPNGRNPSPPEQSRSL